VRAVVSTVTEATVVVAGETVGSVDADRDGAGRGALLALVGVGRDDDPDAWRTVARKIAELRILRPAGGTLSGQDAASHRDASAVDNGAEILVVSQFTLMGATAKGRRPSWSPAAPAASAEPVIERLVGELRARGLTVETGVFGADMAVSSVNDGPFTVLIEA
jgi:D-tyrosyl-tRNA(Tyr) deacylase